MLFFDCFAHLMGHINLLIDDRNRFFFFLQMKNVCPTETTPKALQTPRRERKGDIGEE